MQITRNHSLGILFKILNLIIFTIISLGLVHKSPKFKAIEEFYIICVSGTLFLLPWVIFTKGKYLKTKNLKGYLLRAILSIAGMTTWIEALKNLGPNEATLISYLIPLFTVLLASVIGEEKLHPTPFILILACLIIIFLALKPEIINMDYGLAIALLSALTWASYDLVCKKQTYTEHYLTQAFYTFIFALVLTFPFGIKAALNASPKDLLDVGILGILRVINIICLFVSYKFAPLNILMPFSYLRLPLMAFGTFLLYEKLPTTSISIAATLIIAINLYFFQLQNSGKIVIKERDSSRR
jgi:drug/metabolite transporter (DMT)-like permease